MQTEHDTCLCKDLRHTHEGLNTRLPHCAARKTGGASPQTSGRAPMSAVSAARAVPPAAASRAMRSCGASFCRNISPPELPRGPARAGKLTPWLGRRSPLPRRCPCLRRWAGTPHHRSPPSARLHESRDTGREWGWLRNGTGGTKGFELGSLGERHTVGIPLSLVW